jgi:hypothetical protein
MGQETVAARDVAETGVVIREPWLHTKILARVENLDIVIRDFILFKTWLLNIDDRCWPIQAIVETKFLDWHLYTIEDDAFRILVEYWVLRVLIIIW